MLTGEIWDSLMNLYTFAFIGLMVWLYITYGKR